MERRLATILAADVVGYSRLVGEDEEGTLRTLGDYRGVIDELVTEHRGRVFGSAGDSIVAEFASPVEAVRCAADIQREIDFLNSDQPEKKRMRFRIGINLGDVIVEGDNLLGDGVNVAARLEALSDAGGICLSRPVFDQVKRKLELGYEYLGEQTVKNIAEPVRVYRVLLEPEASGAVVGEAKPKQQPRKWLTLTVAIVLVIGAVAVVAWLRPWAPDVEPASVERMAFPLPEKPSIAVLPFTNMSGDPAQDTFADGMTDDLITDLSKVSDLFVVARNSSFVYKVKPVGIRQVAEDLGVRYVLEGSVQRAGDELRINAQLIDATTGGHLWADRYDGKVSDIFAVQDEFVRKIVGALALNLSENEQEEIARGQSANLEARDAFQKGWEHYFRFTPEDNAKAAEYLLQAVEVDPEYGRAYSALGMVYVRGCQWRWQEELGMTTGEANSTALRYLNKGKEHSSSLTNVAASQIYLYNKSYGMAFTEAARAVALDPNDPEAHVAMALALIATGKAEVGLDFVQTALRLNPSRPSHYVLAQAMAYFSMDDLDQTAEVLNEALERDPDAVELLPFLAATYAHLGRRNDAHALIRQWAPDIPETNLQYVGGTYHVPYPWARNEKDIESRLKDGLYLAGLPSEVTVESLVESLQQEDYQVRKSAVMTLGRFGAQAVEAVPALIDALSDEEPDLRQKAAKALGKVGPAAKAAVPALTALKDDPSVGYEAKRALKKIAGK